MKVRVYRTPTLANPDKAVVSIPQAVQSDGTIRQLDITQEEILPPPSSLNDLLTQAQSFQNPSLDANRSVVETFLTPGFRMKVNGVGDQDEFVEPIQVEEVVIPPEYVHLEDATDWNVFNYGQAWRVTDRNFGVLPGEDRLPKPPKWDVIVKGRSFSAKFQEPITSVRVYYRRENSSEWIDWVDIKSDDVGFLESGKYVFRGVPYIGKYPIPDWKEWERKYNEPESLTWSSLQLDEDSFQVRMEGIVGSDITHVETQENGKTLGVFSLVPNEDGRVEKTIRLDNVSNVRNPKIDYLFIRKNGTHRSLVYRSSDHLQRNYAKEPIGFKVNKVGDEFIINIQDKHRMMYSPLSTLQAFESREWIAAIQRQQTIVYLQIIRHQDGATRNYGTYMCNITKEDEPRFLEAPPFKTKIKRVDRGFTFIFEDSQDFRDVANLDSPDVSRKVAYEFRLIFRTAGIEECLRRQEDYIYIKELPLLVRNKRTSYKYSYSVWKEEHPRRKYTGAIPVDVQYSYLNHHLIYGKSPECFIIQSEPIPAERTKDIHVQPGSWKVLYYLRTSTDEMVEFPFYRFDINVPTSSQMSIDRIELYMNRKNDRLLVGSYHPSDKIQVIEYAGYYEMLKVITQNTNFQKAFYALVGSATERPEDQVYSSIDANTNEKKIDVMVANRMINNAIAKKLYEGVIPYRLEIHLSDGSSQIYPMNVEIRGKPQIGDEPPGNIAFTTGNKTVLPSTFQVDSSMVYTIIKEIERTVIPTLSASI